MENAEEGRPLFAPPNIRATFADDGSIIIDSAQPLGDYETHLGEMLRYWATKSPDRLFLAERNQDDEWRRISYAEAALATDALSQSLIDRGLSAQRPVMVLSGNSIDHALLALGSMQIGIPVVPLSPAYSLMSQDFNKLSALFELVTPGLIYVADQGVFSKALDQLPLEGIELVTSGPISGGGATHFNHLVKTVSTDEVERAFASVTADSIAKILFTSGSTGMPKGVINTHGMLCSNQKSLSLTWPFLEHQPPVLVDWLPWNHTFGGNHNFNMILRNGGTLYIDDGKPAPGLIDKSIKNLKEIAPTLYFNVPAGYNMMLPHLEQDVQLRDRFFEQLQLIFYAAAALPQDLWDRLQAVSIKSRGRTTVLTSAWGSTETAPLATSAHFPLDHAGNIGVPVPGVSLKMVPVESKMELRVKGPNITPGYYRRPDLTDAMFDSEGYYLIGDAGKLINPDNPGDGIEFDGRVAENFKLSTGTWVTVGALRTTVIAAASPIIQDAVVVGSNRDYLGLMVWLNVAACRQFVGNTDLGETELFGEESVRDRVIEGLRAHNRKSGSSMRIKRVLLLTEPPSIDANEITDKGYINQQAVLERRSEIVDKVYSEPPEKELLLIDE